MHKVTGKMQVSVCDRPGDKDIVLPGSAAYTGRNLPISLLTHSDEFFSNGSVLTCGEEGSKNCKIVWRKLHRNMRTIISGLDYQKRIIATATIYFNPSVGDHGGAKVASGLVCWS